MTHWIIRAETLLSLVPTFSECSACSKFPFTSPSVMLVFVRFDPVVPDVTSFKSFLAALRPSCLKSSLFFSIFLCLVFSYSDNLGMLPLFPWFLILSALQPPNQHQKPLPTLLCLPFPDPEATSESVFSPMSSSTSMSSSFFTRARASRSVGAISH